MMSQASLLALPTELDRLKGGDLAGHGGVECADKLLAAALQLALEPRLGCTTTHSNC